MPGEGLFHFHCCLHICPWQIQFPSQMNFKTLVSVTSFLSSQITRVPCDSSKRKKVAKKGKIFLAIFSWVLFKKWNFSLFLDIVTIDGTSPPSGKFSLPPTLLQGTHSALYVKFLINKHKSEKTTAILRWLFWTKPETMGPQSILCIVQKPYPRLHFPRFQLPVVN